MTRRLPLLAAAIAVLAVPAAARADIIVSNVQAAPKETPAGTHSDFTLAFDLGGSETIRDLDVNLPAGLLGNPNGAAKCTKAQFQSDSCPAASEVGTQKVNVTVLLASSDSDGVVYNLVPAAGEPALLGIKLTTPAGTQHLESHVTVRPSDSGLTSTIRGIPNTLGGVPIHINRISLTLSARSGSGQDFMTNPTSCNRATTALHVVGDANGAADGQGGFTPTACDLLPYAPKLTATVGAAGLTAARSVPPLTTIIEQQPGESATKSAKVTLSSPLAPNVAALANVCTVADYDADKCPDMSIVGQAQAVTPLLATPLSGPVRIVENPNNLPKLVVYLNGLINVRLIGAIQLAAEGTTTTFAGIPDVPLSRFKLDFAGGPNGLVGTIADLCRRPATLGGEFVSHSGKTVTVSSTAAVAGCPGGTGGAGGRPVASVSLRRLATASPLLGVTVKRRAPGRSLRSIAVSLPSDLSFDRGTLSVSAKAPKGLAVSLRGKHVLVLRAKSSSGAAAIGAMVTGGALRVSPSLRARVGKHPKLLVTVRATDVAGTTFTLKRQVPAR